MSVRARLTLWYGGLLALVLAVALGVAWAVHWDLEAGDLDDDLLSVWDTAAAQVRAADRGDGTLAAITLTDPGRGQGIWLVDARSRRVVASAGAAERGLGETVALLPEGIQTLTTQGDRVRVLVRTVDAVPSARLVAAASLAAIDGSTEMVALRGLVVVLAVGGIAGALVGGWVLAGAALRPLAILTETARSIAASRTFSRRVPTLRRRDELGELARTFNEMLGSLEAAHELQQRFVSDTSHELRTPLTTVHGNAELLVADGADPAERAEAAAQILRETQRLTRLIDELLVLARADAGSEPFDAARVELDEVLMEAFEELRTQAGHRLRVVALDEAPVLGERDRLKQLVLILLDNALRYTPAEGTIEASVGVDGDEVVLQVDDSGVGVTPDVEARAFDRFYRGDDARRLAPAGTGLGLAIAKWIAERHRGSVSLRPRTPRGTRALVRLPLLRDGRARRVRTTDVPAEGATSAAAGPAPRT